MLAYTVLMLVTIIVAFFAVRFYRWITDSRMTDRRVVSLSANSAQWRPRRQAGFVRPDRRTPSRRAPRNTAEMIADGSIKKPWGW